MDLVAQASSNDKRSDQLSLLVVDDDRGVREACRQVAQELGFDTVAAESRATAQHLLETRLVDIVLLDLRLPEGDGVELLKAWKLRKPEIPFIVMTAYATVQSAVAAMKHGAFDYISKPFDANELRLVLERAAHEVYLATENRILRDAVRANHNFGGLVGTAPAMLKLFQIIPKVARSHHPVLILGESGTGKELVAREIHFQGPNRERPFIPLDCTALVPTLIESELFGYVKGAFTGAVGSKPGLLQMAEGGTLFLDEIGELPTDLQAKLLRAIQHKEIRAVGSTKSVKIDVRILAATNKDLEAAVKAGSFRKDLFYRLNVMTLRTPALRERKEDIPLLANHFLERNDQAAGLNRNFDQNVIRAMMAYDWPGNVRELENMIERACAFNSKEVLQIADFPTQLSGAFATLPPLLPAEGDPSLSMAELERRAILAAIERTRGNKIEAAKILQIGKTTLYRKLKEYGIRVERRKAN